MIDEFGLKRMSGRTEKLKATSLSKVRTNETKSSRQRLTRFFERTDSRKLDETYRH